MNEIPATENTGDLYRQGIGRGWKGRMALNSQRAPGEATTQTTLKDLCNATHSPPRCLTMASNYHIHSHSKMQID